MHLRLASTHDRASVVFGSSELAAGIANDELSLQYQPTINLADGSLSGFEALVRWPLPEIVVLGEEAVVQPPDNNASARALSDWTLREACRQLAAWQDDVLVAPGFRLAVNISGMELDGERLIQSVAGAIAETGVDARGLVVEVTETAAIDSAGAAERSVEGLHALGVELAIDDLGSRYSTFSQLAALPFDVLRINRHFVQDSVTERGQIVLRGLSALGSSLDVRLVAEGVETHEQAALLRSLGCHEGQGPAWAPPLSASEAKTLLVTGTCIAGIRRAV